jgi:predicted MFS family arabinose efflux permease
LERLRRVPRLFIIMMGASFLLNLSFGLYRSVFSNFAAQELGVSYLHYGYLEGIREIPGLLTILLVAMAARLKEEKLYAISGSLIGMGIWLYASAHSYADLVLATLVQSMGFHVWQVVQDAMVMKSVSTENRARRLGQINSVAAMATLLGMGLVALLSVNLGLRPYFRLAGIIGLAGGLLALLLRTEPESVKPVRFVFRWQYRSYYILTLLQGARRHIVMTFAIFLLVKTYGVSVQTLAILLAVHSFLSIWIRPQVGRLIDRFGEQRTLSLNYAVVALIFIGYAFIHQPWVLYLLFVIDNLLTGFDIAVSTHAGRIIPRTELASSLATGTTINHIFGVAVPVIGGYLWERFDQSVPFMVGASLVFIAMVYSWNLDRRTQALPLLPASSAGN